MEEFYIFEILDLQFDPPEKSVKTVVHRFDKKRAELGSALGRATQQTKRDAIQAQIDYLDGIAKQIFSSDRKKLEKHYEALAQQKTKKEMDSLSATVALLALTGGHTVTENTLRHYRKETKLSPEHVKQIFVDAGFKIIDFDPLKAYPKFPTNAEKIYSEIIALTKEVDPNPNGPDNTVVTDLYAFAAYLSDDIDNIPMYRTLMTPELSSIFDAKSKQLSQRNDNLGKLCASLSTAAKTYVFNSDENRKAYEMHLLYHSEELTKLFLTMKKAPESTLLSSKFADACIRIISKYFPEYEVALAIYNKEAGFLDNYYLPTEWVYTIKCSYCEFVNEFETETEAQKKNTCQNCKKELYKKCDKCGKLVPVFKESCPHCNYVFASAALFSKYYQQAESAFRKCDFELARQLLFKAQSVAPNEKSRIQNLSKKIDEEENKTRKPVNTLKQLITDRSFQTARKELARIIREYPNLNVSDFERTINSELSRMDALFASTKGLSSSRKADVCISILMQCVDYDQAISYLRATPPEQVKSVSVASVANTGVINVSWSPSKELGTSYRLVRKTGNHPSISENDGTILLDNANTNAFSDYDALPGQNYVYSVFVIRMAVFSTPSCKSGIVFSNVQNCRLVQNSKSIRITWDAPKNSMGATIKRECEGHSLVLTRAAFGSFEDTSIEYGKTYIYKVCTNYSNGNLSPGIEHVVTPLIVIESFSFRINQVKGNVYKVSWSIKEKGIDLRILVNGKVNAEIKSDILSTQISLPNDSFCVITLLAFSGGQWISSSNTEEVNTYMPCPIDKKATEYEEKMMSGRNGVQYQATFKIKLSERIPQNAVGFYYAIRSTKSSNRWASQSEIGSSSDIQRISINEYNRLNAISFQDYVSNETTFFISVFTIYDVGKKEIVSLPSKLKVNRPLLANLFWRVSYSRFDGLKLSIELSGNKPIEYIPALILCASEGDRFIAAPDDKNAIVLSKKSSMELEIPEGIVQKNFIIPTELPPKYIKKCKFFLFENELAEDDKIMLRWKQGFSGKV